MGVTRQVPPAASIAAALSMSAPGDFVEVTGTGTHSSGIVHERPGVTVIGSNPDVTVRGQVYAKVGAADGRITGLTLVNGGNTARVNPAIEANRFRLDHNTIVNEDFGIAVHVGAAGVVTYDAIVEHNVIKDVGRKPWTNYDHAVYFRNTVRAKVRHNTILDGGDYAFHFWGPALDTEIAYNLVMGGWAGAVIFGGNSGGWSRGTRMFGNIVYGPPRSGRAVVYEYWDSAVTAASIAAADNLAYDNIIVTPTGTAAVQPSPRGFVSSANIVRTTSPVIRTGDVCKINDPIVDGYGPDSIQRVAVPPPPPDPDPEPDPDPDPDPTPDPRIAELEGLLAAALADLATAQAGRLAAESKLAEVRSDVAAETLRHGTAIDSALV